MMKFNSSNIDACNKYYQYADNVRNALVKPLRRFPMLKNYVLVIDEEEAILLFPLNDLNRVNKQLKEIVLNDLINNFKTTGLNLKEVKGASKDSYKLGFIPICFKILRI